MEQVGDRQPRAVRAREGTRAQNRAIAERVIVQATAVQVGHPAAEEARVPGGTPGTEGAERPVVRGAARSQGPEHAEGVAGEDEDRGRRRRLARVRVQRKVAGEAPNGRIRLGR